MSRAVLLVCDDIALVATVRRLLERDGRESILATSVADALIAYGHYAPGLVVLAPSVEGNRGRFVLEELSKHPASARARVLLLGSGIDDSLAPMIPLPLDGTAFLRALSDLESATTDPEAEIRSPAESEPTAAVPNWWHPTPKPAEASQPVPSRSEAPRQPTELQSSRAVERPSPRADTPSDDIDEGGRVTLEQVAELLMRLCNSRAAFCLELKSSDAVRTLWLREGRLVGAASSLYEESLLSRARADGLLDREQEKELRQQRIKSPTELLRAMRTSGYLREVEVVPLVQRHSEQIAIEALSQDESIYRLSTDGLEGQAVAAASPALAMQMLPRAFKRTMSEESILASFGGLDAIPVPREQASALSILGMTDRELELLNAVDGTLSVGELLLSCGLPQEQALKTLRIGCLLRAIDIRPGTKPPGAPGPDVDVRRLKSKFDEVQEADYFSVLGLPRSAGVEEVRRAFEVLSNEFSPLKFAGHSDPTLQRQAEQIQDLLVEAAQALQDDRLRSAYAGNLVD